MAILMLGKSDSSCRTCAGKGANGTVPTHDVILASRYNPKTKRLDHMEIPGCGEEWEGIQSTYYYPDGYWEDWCRKPSVWVLRDYEHFIGKPCYDAFGKFVCNFAEGLDIQLPFVVE